MRNRKATIHDSHVDEGRDPDAPDQLAGVEIVGEIGRVVSFKASHPGIAIELETDDRGVDPVRRDLDA